VAHRGIHLRRGRVSEGILRREVEVAEGDGIIDAMTNPDEQTPTPSPDVVPTYDALLEMLVRLAHKQAWRSA